MKELKDIWKEFGRVRPSHRALHHLMAVYHLSRENGFATSASVAGFLNIKRPPVSDGLAGLKKSGYLLADTKHRYRLSAKGAEIVNTVLAKRQIVRQFLAEILGLSPLEAMADACKIEHLLSQKAAERLTALVGLLKGESASARECLDVFRQTTEFCRPDERCEGCPAPCCYAIPQARSEAKAG